jgi:hypothetical protein
MNRFTIALLATAVGLLLLVEGVNAWTFEHKSRVQRLQLAQRHALLAVRDLNSSDPAHIVLLGNSLLLEGVNVQSLTKQTEPRAIPVPYFVLATEYYDWYFGLKRLFAEGVRPRYVLLGLSPNQFASSNTRGEYSARFLFRWEDLIAVAHDTHMNATATSSLVLGHVSEFWSTRQITRGYLLGELLPGVSALLHDVGTGRDPAIPEATLKALATDRLASLDALCRTNGAQFLFVVPPSYQTGSETIAEAGRDLHVPVLVPVANDELDGSSFQSDGIHLNEKGAAIFTNRLAADLQKLISSSTVAFSTDHADTHSTQELASKAQGVFGRSPDTALIKLRVGQ